MSKMTSVTYKVFMVEVGVYDSILFRSWKGLTVLATKHTWYYNLWELCKRLGVELELEDMYHIKPVKQGDRSIIDVALDMGHKGKILESNTAS